MRLSSRCQSADAVGYHGPVTSFAFDSVLFDLDGTLVATERYWPDAARAATRALFTELGLERAVPTTAEWLDMVGRPMPEAFDHAFPDLGSPVRRRLREACEAEERALLSRGHAAMLDSVEETLVRLSQMGVRLGVASNCGTDYLEAMMDGLGIARWVEEARCLRSPGVSNKADMIADLLLHFDTRSAVMVGDRRGDRDAAWANGVPFVYIPRGYGALHEEVDAEATLDGIDQLLPCLGQRDEVLAGLLERVAGAKTLGVVGLPMAGKTLMAKDLRRVAEAAGRALEVLDDPEDAGLAACDALLRVTASEDVLVRRAKGLRLGVGPVEALIAALPGARDRSEATDAAVTVDAGNPLLPHLV